MSKLLTQLVGKTPFSRPLTITLVLFLGLVFNLHGQNKTITGVVTSLDDNLGLIGVNVVEKGTSNGTVTDFDGKYSVSVPAGAVLEFSYTGYQLQAITVGSESTINVQMSYSAELIDEVVVVGYGSQRKSNVTGAISSIDADEITALPVATVDQALQGRAAGVTVINNGSPGDAPTIRIRGLGTINNNEPLYVIDGVISSGGIGDINSSDIESIQILKDASTTAVYGAKGSNGVILVTTKKGRTKKTSVSLSSYAGNQWSNNRFDLLNTQQYIQYATEAWGAPERLTDPQYASLLQNDTDWQEEIFQNGLMQSHNASVSGGTENSNFRISGGYLSQEGIMKTTALDRYNFRANSSFDIGKLTVGETFSVSIADQAPLSESGGRSVIEHAIKMAPYFPVYNSSNIGGYQGPNSAVDAQDAENPVRVLEHGSRKKDDLGLLGSVFAQYEILKGLTFRTQAGGEFRKFEFNNFLPSYADDNIGGTGILDHAIINRAAGSLTSIILTNSLVYDFTLSQKHNFQAMLLSESTNTKTANLNAASDNFISNDVNQISNTNANVTSFSSEYARLGYLGRVNYAYDNKYILAASLRRDASSRFGPNNRWGTFPSVAVGWVLSNEDFLAGSNNINLLKIRGSWGKTGNDNIPDYRFSTGIESNFHYPIAGSDALGATVSGLANKDLKWEETTMTNIGLDVALFDYAVTASLEVYTNESNDLLIPRILPLSSGFHNGTVIENVGAIKTQGVELSLGYNSPSDKAFQWSLNLNLGTNKNEVLDLGTNESIVGGGFENENISYSEVGNSAYQFYGWQFDGIFQNQAEVEAHAGGSQAANLNAAPGDFRIVDVNGDGEINADDRTIIGNPFPDFTYGLNLGANYKGFDIGLFFNGVAGNDVYNTNIYDLEGMPRLFNAGVSVLDRWTGAGTSNTIPRAGGAATNTQVSSRFVEDGSFTRLRNVSIGYDLTDKVFNGKVSKFRVYVSGQNLLTFTNYSGLDPEIGAYVATGAGEIPGTIGGVATNANGQPTGNFELGIDRGNYPVAKSFIFGFDVTF